MSINGVVTLNPVTPKDAVLQPSALPPFGVAEIRKRTHAIQEVMKGVMKEGTHYGTIPGTPKPSLWKAGAEVLCMTFRLAPILESQVVVDDTESEWPYTAFKRDGAIINGICIGFFEVEAICTMQAPGGEVLSRCSARCNNREAKYRSLSIYEIRNTVQKMAEKRAFVSAVLMATGASDIFTQDVEDFPELIEGRVTHHGAKPKPESQPAPHEAAPPQSQDRPTEGTGNGLSPKREAWLMRVAQESQIAPEVLQRCLDYLKGASGKQVGAFFDELARRKGEVFVGFAK